MLIVLQVGSLLGTGLRAGSPASPSRLPPPDLHGCAPSGAAGCRGRSAPGPDRRLRERAGCVSGKTSLCGLGIAGLSGCNPEPQRCGDISEMRMAGASRLVVTEETGPASTRKLCRLHVLGRLGPKRWRPPKGVRVRVPGSPGVCSPCVILRRETREMLSSSAPGCFCRWARVETTQLFLSLPLRGGYCFP